MRSQPKKTTPQVRCGFSRGTPHPHYISVKLCKPKADSFLGVFLMVWVILNQIINSFSFPCQKYHSKNSQKSDSLKAQKCVIQMLPKFKGCSCNTLYNRISTIYLLQYAILYSLDDRVCIILIYPISAAHSGRRTGSVQRLLAIN